MTGAAELDPPKLNIAGMSWPSTAFANNLGQYASTLMFAALIRLAILSPTINHLLPVMS